MGATFAPHFWELNQMQYFFKIKAKEQRKLRSSQNWISCAQTCKTLLWYCPGCTQNAIYDFYVTQSFASWIIRTLPFPTFTFPLHDKSFKYIAMSNAFSLTRENMKQEITNDDFRQYIFLERIQKTLLNFVTCFLHLDCNCCFMQFSMWILKNLR